MRMAVGIAVSMPASHRIQMFKNRMNSINYIVLDFGLWEDMNSGVNLWDGTDNLRHEWTVWKDRQP
jgi:hypothetical protein